MSKGSNRTVGQIQDQTLAGFAHAIRNAKFDNHNGIAPSFAPTKVIARPEPARRFSLNACTRLGVTTMPVEAAYCKPARTAKSKKK
jgi:hypothetical protein